MRLGVFTPLLSQLPLEGVLAKLKALQISTVELATGNYPGNAHCKLSMLQRRSRLERLQAQAGRPWHRHQRAELPWESAAPGPGTGKAGAGRES